MKNKDELKVIADRCTPSAIAFLRTIQDVDMSALIIDALKITDGAITEATILVTLMQLKDALKKQ